MTNKKAPLAITFLMILFLASTLFTLPVQSCPPPIELEFPQGSSAVPSISILPESELPPCIPPLPEGIVTPYIAVVISSGDFDGAVEVGLRYEDKGDDELESKLRLYMADCVDFNRDDTIDGKDVGIIKKGIRMGETHSSENVPFDINGDGVADKIDVKIVQYYSANGLIVNEGKNSKPEARLPWIDITTRVDTGANIVYGETEFFSIFGCR